jgi:hypothetical protein
LEVEQLEWSKSWSAREIAAKDHEWSIRSVSGLVAFDQSFALMCMCISPESPLCDSADIDGSEALDFKKICDVVVFSELDVLRKLQQALFRETRALLRLQPSTESHFV